MNDLNKWQLSDHLSIVQAALLVCNLDPARYQSTVEDADAAQRPSGYEAAKAAISNALQMELIEGQLIPHYYYNDEAGPPAGEVDGSIDPAESIVEVESLRAWLAGRGVTTGFFFPTKTLRKSPAYLDRNHPRYAPKLAAAVAAWEACSDNSTTQGKSPKQALTNWVLENAKEFGLCSDEGVQNREGINQVATVANWDPKGGAPRTPGA